MEFDNTQDIINAHELKDRIKELSEAEDLVEELVASLEDAEDEDEREEIQAELDEAQADFDEDAAEELKILKEALSECGGDGLIHEDYFKTFSQDLAESCFDIGEGWPFTCIDWDEAAEELLHDYTPVDIDGETYYTRG